MSDLEGFSIIDNCNLPNQQRLLANGYTHVVPDENRRDSHYDDDGFLTLFMQPIKHVLGEHLPRNARRIVDLDGTYDVSYCVEEIYTR